MVSYLGGAKNPRLQLSSSPQLHLALNIITSLFLKERRKKRKKENIAIGYNYLVESQEQTKILRQESAFSTRMLRR